MARIGRLLSFSNVIACTALFVALGGSVYAAGKLSGTQIKANSLPGNRVKAKTLTAKQVKPGSLTGAQIQAGSLTGAQIQAGSLTGTQIKAGSLTGAQINVGSLTGVTASALSSVKYVVTTAALGGPSPATATASCPSGTNVIGGGATVSNDGESFVNDTAPNGSRNGWEATGFGSTGTTMTVTAICTAIASTG